MLDDEVTQDVPEIRRFVVLGDDSLAHRLTDELVNRHIGRVTVLARTRRRGHAPRIARLEGVDIIEEEQVDGDLLAAADLPTADALALLDRDDVANMDAAMRAHELNPQLRVVVRMYNTSLGAGLAQLPYCTVLSDAAMAAPAFVAAATGEHAASVRLSGARFEVTAKTGARPEDVVCGLAVTAGRDEPELLPFDQQLADLVLVKARRSASKVEGRLPRLTHHYPVRFVLARIWRRLRLISGVTTSILLASAVVLALSRDDIGWWQAAHIVMLDAFGGASADLTASTLEQVLATLLGFLSIALIPLVTATVVDAIVKSRLELRDGTLARRASDHVVVVGLGAIGGQVLRLLHDQGVDVIGIDSSPAAAGVQVANDLQIPVTIGDATRRETLIAASVQTCRTLMCITSDDGTNLESALVGRSLRADIPIVLRLFDGDFADRIQQAFNLTVSRSVSYLAAPSFAAHMIGQALDTIPIQRHVLLVANLTLGPDCALEGETVGRVRRPNESWVIEVTNPNGQRFAALAAGGRRLQRGDALLVVATRRGLARLIAETTAPSDAVRHKPIVLHDTPTFQRGPDQLS